MLQCPSTVRDYELLEIIGDGAFAIVYKAIYIPTEQKVAIKVISKDIIKEEAEKERLQREIDVMIQLQHINIVTLHDFFEEEQNYFLVMDLCSGGDLWEYMMASQRMKEVQAATIFHQLITAIDFCHTQGIVHRDLKPQNILITTFPYVKLCDFGLCQYFSDPNMKMKTSCGSPFYAAPECLQGKPYNGPSSDMWSLGVILYEIVTKQHPWPYDNPTLMLKRINAAKYNIPNDVSPPCMDLIQSLIKVRPTDRLTPKQVLSHPWMKLAMKKPQRVQTLPRLSLDAHVFPMPTKYPAPFMTPNKSLAHAQSEGVTPVKSDIVSPFSQKMSNAARIQLLSSRGKTNQFERVMTMSKSPRSSNDSTKVNLKARPRTAKLSPL